MYSPGNFAAFQMFLVFTIVLIPKCPRCLFCQGIELFWIQLLSKSGQRLPSPHHYVLVENEDGNFTTQKRTHDRKIIGIEYSRKIIWKFCVQVIVKQKRSNKWSISLHVDRGTVDFRASAAADTVISLWHLGKGARRCWTKSFSHGGSQECREKCIKMIKNA